VVGAKHTKIASVSYNIQLTNIQGVQKKIARSLMHHHFASVCSRIKRFLSKLLGKIIVYQSMQTLYQPVKYSLMKSQNWIHMSDVTLHVNMTPLTDRLLIKTANWKKAGLLEKMIVECQARQYNGIYAVWYLTHSWVYWLR